MNKYEVNKYWLNMYKEDKIGTIAKLSQGMRHILSSKLKLKYYEFINFDITSKNLPEQIEELEKKFVEILQDPEIEKLVEKVYSDDIEKKKEKFKSYIYDILTSENPKLDEMCWIKTKKIYDSTGWFILNFPELNKPITNRMVILSKAIGKPYIIKDKFSYGPNNKYNYEYENEIISSKDMTPKQKQLAEIAKRELKAKKVGNDKSEKGKFLIVGFAISENEEFIGIDPYGFDKRPFIDIEIDISKDELLSKGINPDEMRWEPLGEIKEEQYDRNKNKRENKMIKKTKISSKDIAEADKKQAIITKEVSEIKRFMKKTLDKIKGIGEK